MKIRVCGLDGSSGGLNRSGESPEMTFVNHSGQVADFVSYYPEATLDPQTATCWFGPKPWL